MRISFKSPSPPPPPSSNHLLYMSSPSPPKSFTFIFVILFVLISFFLFFFFFFFDFVAFVSHAKDKNQIESHPCVWQVPLYTLHSPLLVHPPFFFFPDTHSMIINTRPLHPAVPVAGFRDAYLHHRIRMRNCPTSGAAPPTDLGCESAPHPMLGVQSRHSIASPEKQQRPYP